jgi:GAF domain-containing protein
LELLLASAVLLAAWRAWAVGVVGEFLWAANLDPRLLAAIISVAALSALVYRAARLAASAPDEIVVPICYWATAMLLGALLSLVAWRQPEAFWWQVRGLELFGCCALLGGLSLGNERAHRRAAEQMAELEALQSISWSLVGAPSVAGLAGALSRAMAQSFDAAAVAVYLRGETDEDMVIAGVSGVEDDLVRVGATCSLRPDRRPGFHNGHTARALASGDLQVLPEILSDVEFLPWRVVAREEGTVISVPLPYQERFIGVVNLFLVGVRRISQSRLRLLETVAAAVSTAIEHARHTEEEVGRSSLAA